METDHCMPYICFPELIIVPYVEDVKLFLGRAFKKRDPKSTNAWLIEVMNATMVIDEYKKKKP